MGVNGVPQPDRYRKLGGTNRWDAKKQAKRAGAAGAAGGGGACSSGCAPDLTGLSAAQALTGSLIAAAVLAALVTAGLLIAAWWGGER